MQRGLKNRWIKYRVGGIKNQTYTKAATGLVLWKNMFLKTLQNSRENTCTRNSFLIKSPWHRCFLLKFETFLRTPFLQNTSGRLLLNTDCKMSIIFILISSSRYSPVLLFYTPWKHQKNLKAFWCFRGV